MLHNNVTKFQWKFKFKALLGMRSELQKRDENVDLITENKKSDKKWRNSKRSGENNEAWKNEGMA